MNPASEAQLADWYVAGQTGNGSPLLDGTQVRALLDYAFERLAIVGVVEAYELRGGLEIPTIEQSLYGDAPSLNVRPWRNAISARRAEVIAQLRRSSESRRDMRFQLWVWLETN